MSQSIKALSQLLCTRTTQLYISSWRNQRILLNGLHTSMAGRCIYALNHQSIEMGRFHKNTMRSTGTPPLAPVPQHHALHPAYRHISSLWGGGETTEWSRAVSEAEKIVGYSTSFMSLRFLLSDELANVAGHMRRLVGSKHPLMKTARSLLSRKNGNIQTRGLLILLVAKAASSSSHATPLINTYTNVPKEELISHTIPTVDETIPDDISNSQRQLAEIAEVIHTAYLVHRGVIDLDGIIDKDSKESADMEFGNKMATLTGDFLLANVATGLAELENTYVVEIMSEAIRDLMSAEFSSVDAYQILEDNSKTPHTLKDWETYVYLSSASLLSKACRCVLMLAGSNSEYIETAGRYGEYLSYAHKLQEELKVFTNPSTDNNSQTHLLSAPVTLHLQSDSEDHHQLLQLFDEEGKADSAMVSYHLSQSSALEQTRKLCEMYGNKALEQAAKFEHNDARASLTKIVNVIMNNL